MSWKTLFRNPEEGILEIEESYIRFLVPDGISYTCTTIPANQADIISILRQNLAKIMGDVRQISIITNYQTGIKVLPFPARMDNKNIVEHLQLKREEYFGVKGECEFILRPTASTNKDGNEMLVSYILKSFFNSLREICHAEGYALNRVTNIVEAMIGAYLVQADYQPGEQVCLLDIGYSNINMVVLKKGQPIAVRTSLTGSIKEIENRLMSVLKLNRPAVEDLLSGKSQASQSSIELLQQNERELLSRISPFFAYVRSLETSPAALDIFLAMPYIAFPDLPGLLEQNFKARVYQLDATNNQQIKSSGVKADFGWLPGIFARDVLSFNKVRPIFLRFSITPRLAWMFVILFMLAPLGLAKLSIQSSNNQLTALKGRYSEVENLHRQSQENLVNFTKLQTLGALIQAEISKAKPTSQLISKLAEMSSDELRLEKLEINCQTNMLSLSGVSIDNEIALKFWDLLEKSPETSNVRIDFAEKQDQLFPKFTISAELGKE